MTAAAIFELDAQVRDDMGKGASRRLRRLQEVIPAIVYGGNEAPTPISLDHKKIMQVLEHEAFYSHILTLNLGGKKQQQVVLKDVQRHPYKRAILHMDFQRVKSTDMITMNIPLHFASEDTCPGVKSGGLVNHLMNDIEIRCQAGKLPEFLEVDLSSLELDSSIHLSDIKLPEGSEIPALAQGQDLPVVSVHLPRSAKVEDESSAPGDEGDAKAADSAEKDKK